MNAPHRNPHFLLLAFCAGIVALRFFAELPSAFYVGGLTLLLAVCAWRVKLFYAPLAFALGFCWALAAAIYVSANALPLHLEKQDVVITGTVVGVPQVTAEVLRFDFEVEELKWQSAVEASPGKVRLKIYTRRYAEKKPAERIKINSGERWRFTARLKRARGYQNPGTLFNYETYLFHHRLRASGYVRDKPPPQFLQPRGKIFSLAVDNFRARAANFIRSATAADQPAALIAALTVGIRNDMTAHTWDVLLRTGTIHLVAISGLHIGMVSGLMLLLGTFAWRFAGRLPLYLPAPKAGVAVGLLAGLIYAMLAGMTVPTQRAVCMLSVVALALFFRRRPFGFETLVIALAVVLAVDPLAALGGGLWLSFVAVAVLVLAALRARQITGGGTVMQLTKKLGAWSGIQLILMVGMAPLLLALFNRVSLVAPLANLIAIPVIGILAVPLALSGLFFYALGLESLAAPTFQAAAWVITHLWRVLEWLSAFDFAVWQQSPPPLWSLPLAVVGVIIFLAPKAVPARWSGLLWMLPLFATQTYTPAAGEFRYTMLDVGNGLASVVQTQNHLLVYDAGPKFTGGFDAGGGIVAPFLQHIAAKKIDAFVVSHGDNDHSGGYEAVLKQFPAARILSGTPFDIPQVIPSFTGYPNTVQKCHAGQTWLWDEVRFEILWPPLKHNGDGNESSCVLKVSSARGYGKLLLTGDIGKRTEHILAGDGDASNLSVDILQAPHHGSKTSSTETFLRRTQPSATLVSVGHLNRYGHPHKIVAARYTRQKIPLHSTATEGALIATFAADKITVHSQRGAYRKYWLQKPKDLVAPLIVFPKVSGLADVDGLIYDF